MRALVVVLVLLGLVAAVPAEAQLAKPQTVSLDSEAPPGAPPHWLPNERWVMQHWIPYDETRLYELLGVTRQDIWDWLRDDTHNIAELAAQRGWEARALARALVAPWRGKLREPHRLAVLETRALRTLTQGHLAQHIFFHSLHQDAIPDAAPEIFGTSTERFRFLRRSELSPLMICRLNGHSRAHAQESAERALRDMAERGVEGQAMPASQGARLLARQLRQVPRWLAQTRYNGPPPLRMPRGSIATASNYSNNAALAGDGRHLAYESYEASLAVAKTRGEIGVVASTLGGEATLIRRPDPGGRMLPASAYNPSISEDGRFVAFESAEGNFNFAKRYGHMAVWVRDVRRGTTALASHGISDAPFSAYNPSLSADGRRVAFETSESENGELDVWVADLAAPRAGTARAAGASGAGGPGAPARPRRVPPPAGVASDLYEPALSPDGRFLAFTALARLSDAGPRQSEVYLRDLRTGETVQVSDPTGGESWEPVVSAGGRHVAYTHGRRVIVRDLATGAAAVVAPPDASAAASEPSLSRDGTRVAFTARGAGPDSTSVYVHDLTAGRTLLASRATGIAGAPALGASSHPSLSADGHRVAFTSDAWNLSAGKCNPARGIFVRDLERDTTTLVSRGDGANAGLGPTKGSGGDGAMRIALLCG
jgi:Tol biopolymer transport system component